LSFEDIRAEDDRADSCSLRATGYRLSQKSCNPGVFLITCTDRYRDPLDEHIARQKDALDRVLLAVAQLRYRLVGIMNAADPLLAGKACTRPSRDL